MMFSSSAAAVACVLALAQPASALMDSGVKYKGCGSNQSGYITLNLRGTANTWGPGDWDRFPTWRDTSGWWRPLIDGGGGYQGGNYRVYANDAYNSLAAHCSTTG